MPLNNGGAGSQAPSVEPVFELSFAESEVLEVRQLAGQVDLVFAAGAVLATQASRPSGPLVAVAGYVRHLVARLDGTGPVDAAGCCGRIRSASLQVDGVRQGAIALPGRFGGRVRLEVDFANGTTLRLDGTGIHLHFNGDPDFRESLAC